MNPSTDPNQILKLWFFRFVKTGLFLSIVLAFYLVYLDAWVQERMAGPKWQTPVKVFARPLNLYPHYFLPKKELIEELELLGYQQTKALIKPGQFSVKTNYVEIYRRHFVYAEGELDAKKIRVGFEKDRIAQVASFVDTTWQVTPIELLDPVLISRQTHGTNEDRDIVDLSLVPEWMVDTLLVVEDRNFYHHYGVSPSAIARALWANLMAGRKVQGGSTLTQQLAKNLLLNDNRKTYLRKIKEAFIALILDYRFSKDAILEAYFNEIYLGQDGGRAIHGFALASKYYFNKLLVNLSPEQFALLTAMVKGPSYYSPTKHADRTRQRRDLVLQLMVSENVITRDEYQLYVSSPMEVDLQKRQGKSRFPSYIQLVERELKALDLQYQNERGLLVFTGLDPVLQKNYQKHFGQSVKKLQTTHKLKDVNGAVVSISLEDGSISALIGDKNPHAYGFNRALDANRNIGSLIKPAVYLAGLRSGKFHLGSQLSNMPISMENKQGQTWQPENYDKKSSETIMLHDALSQSVNLATVHLGMDVGLNKIIDTLHDLGVNRNIPHYPSLMLGAISMSPVEVASMFLPIANFGQKQAVSAITKVTDKTGFVLWQKDVERKQVVDYASSYELGFALNSVTKTGTAMRLGKYYPKVSYGGKTGTTDDLRDSWFVGFDQNKVTSIWVGKDDNSPVELTGSRGALSIFIALQQARQAESVLKPQPNDIEMRFVDKTNGEILSGECGENIALPINTNKIGLVTECPSIFDWF
ncbi:penicillin-binding protein 1B [Psychrosphaera sp. 1_MG-2023]|uniref:penicillin-binding protein 1B n=1 Tax=Psychrosphaera sp. 1_MG-2023 TaxID=3062643 RepID=UPI0026E36272|nr:penicillin-binding protein 1B [Psychrosphaera sp. 1_MG-2023]MDO6718242.1 penicillin-binding protein 1B [Psychrosphaera sp. 1_MG-2023]